MANINLEPGGDILDELVAQGVHVALALGQQHRGERQRHRVPVQRDTDHKRNGTTTLFAALNVFDGTVIGQNMQKHRHQEFIRFLNKINANVPADKAIHIILDNYAAHKHPKVRAWLDRHTRFTFHFTPTSCSWLNAVEGFFAKLTRRRLKNGVFHSVVDLQAAINRFTPAIVSALIESGGWHTIAGPIRISPTESSMPAVRITSVCALARMPTTATCCMISVSV